ncbi:MAG: tetratricopeptide repeat protein [Cyanobacteria bacterium P01_H01_bin.15]
MAKQPDSRRKLQRLMLLIFGLGFGGVSLVTFLGFLSSSRGGLGGGNAAQGDTPSQAEVLALQEEGFQAVLRREPNNVNALQGLAQIYLGQRNFPQAITVLEKLAEQYPKDEFPEENAQLLTLIDFVIQEEVNAAAGIQEGGTTAESDAEQGDSGTAPADPPANVPTETPTATPDN